MKVVTLLAQKGGVGKTTLTLHYAIEAQRSGAGRVVVIDTDPQGSASKWSTRRQADDPLMLAAQPDALPRAVEACRADGVDLVFVDTPPHAEASAAHAARLADLCVVPCGSSVLDIEAIGETVAILDAVGASGVVVLNRGRHSSSINGQAAQALAGYELPICPTVVMRRAALEDAFIDGRAVAELRPNSKAAQEISDSWRWIASHLSS
jgi:chromosome partitioning protein